MGSVRMRPATDVTAPPEQPELHSLRADFGHLARQEVGHLVNGCAAAEALP
jgi:hypothetical protein